VPFWEAFIDGNPNKLLLQSKLKLSSFIKEGSVVCLSCAEEWKIREYIAITV